MPIHMLVPLLVGVGSKLLAQHAKTQSQTPYSAKMTCALCHRSTEQCCKSCELPLCTGCACDNMQLLTHHVALFTCPRCEHCVKLDV